MSQLNLILYILGSDWYFRRKLQWLMLKLHMYEKKVFSLKEGAVKNGDINWRGMGLLSYPILSTLSSNLILSYLTLKCSRWQDDWNWREVAATAGLHHFSKGARGKFKESWIQILTQKLQTAQKWTCGVWDNQNYLIISYQSYLIYQIKSKVPEASSRKVGSRSRSTKNLQTAQKLTLYYGNGTLSEHLHNK